MLEENKARKPKISVIMLTYNRENLVGRSIRVF